MRMSDSQSKRCHSCSKGYHSTFTTSGLTSAASHNTVHNQRSNECIIFPLVRCAESRAPLPHLRCSEEFSICLLSTSFSSLSRHCFLEHGEPEVNFRKQEAIAYHSHRKKSLKQTALSNMTKKVQTMYKKLPSPTAYQIPKGIRTSIL